MEITATGATAKQSIAARVTLIRGHAGHVAISAIAIACLATAPAASADAQSGTPGPPNSATQLSDGTCEVTSTLPTPGNGQGVTQSATIDPATCTVSAGPVVTASASSVASEPASTPADPTVSGPLDGGAAPSTVAQADVAHAAVVTPAAIKCRTWNTSEQVFDNNVANIEINGLSTQTRYCGNGSTLTSGASGKYQYHVHEEVAGVCNPLGCGWVAHNVSYKTTSYQGCSTNHFCQSEYAKAQADFTYSGDFDPFGRVVGYHNYLVQYNRFNGNATAACKQVFRAKVNPGHVGPVHFFYWKHGCSQSSS